ncbi:MAG: CPBP family intramembrane metalloprotease [Rhodoferax sp.]|nr:CPBP family intramembrane metalloprotease [Rhodoferax sp.]
MIPTADLRQDRMALLLFFGLASALCTAAYIPILTGGGFAALGGYALPLLMWSPGIAGLLTSLIVYRSLAPLGLGGNSQAPYWMLGCIGLPIAYALLTKGGLAAVGFVGLGGTDLSTTLLFTGMYYSLRTALGEELGWRGFAAPVMTRVFGFWRGQTLLGVFWFLFHVPALLGTSYGSSPHLWFGNAMFFVTCMSLGYVLGWVRLQSGSVWPSALFHASHNLYFLHLFEPVTLNNSVASYLVGEQGLLCALVQVALALFVLWRWRRQAPPGVIR